MSQNSTKYAISWFKYAPVVYSRFCQMRLFHKIRIFKESELFQNLVDSSCWKIMKWWETFKVIGAFRDNTINFVSGRKKIILPCELVCPLSIILSARISLCPWLVAVSFHSIRFGVYGGHPPSRVTRRSSSISLLEMKCLSTLNDRHPFKLLMVPLLNKHG